MIIWEDKILESRLAINQYNSKSCTGRDKKRIHKLIESIKRDGLLNGIGKPETLKHRTPTRYSRRVNGSDRLVYDVIYNDETGKSTLRIYTYKFHYID